MQAAEKSISLEAGLVGNLGKNIVIKIQKNKLVVLKYINEICFAIDANKREFGFLPRSAIENHAQRGRLWIAVNENDELCSFIMFGGGRSSLPVFMIHTISKFQGKGVAKALLNELKNYALHSGYQTLSARVAADLSANRFWDKSGFRLVRQAKGGRTTNRKINIRVFEVPDTSIFGRPLQADIESCLLFNDKKSGIGECVLDLNVLLDGVRDRNETEYARRLIKQAFNGSLCIRVTPEFCYEFSRNSTGKDDPLLRIADNIPVLHEIDQEFISNFIDETWREIFPHRLNRNELTVNEESDLRHLAYCSYYSMPSFITRDGAILRKSEWILSNYQIEILTPFEVVEEIDCLRGNEEISVVEGVSSIAIRPASPKDEKKFSECLRKEKNKKIYSAYSRDTKYKRYVCVKQDEVVAFAFVYINGRNPVNIDIVYGSDTISSATSYIDLVLGLISESIQEDGFCVVNFYLDEDNMESREALSGNGFRHVKASGEFLEFYRLCRILHRGIVDNASWSRIVSLIEMSANIKFDNILPDYITFRNTGIKWREKTGRECGFLDISNVESLIAPGLLAVKNRPAVLVPIKYDYARHLLNLKSQTEDMFGLQSVSLLEERVYFRSPRMAKIASVDAFIFFYVSGLGRVTTVARILSSDVRDIKLAIEYYKKNGVLREDEIRYISSKHGSVHCIRFGNIHNFRNSISLSVLRSKGIADSSNIPTIRRLSSVQADILISMSK